MPSIEREINRFKIVVIESMPAGERHTGNELYNELLQYKPYFNKNVTVQYFTVDTKTELFDVLKNVEQNLAEDEIVTLHFESHGDAEGMVLSSGDYVRWKELFVYTRPINEKCTHLLLPTMSMCYGGLAATEIDPEKRAPFRAILGTPREAWDSDLYECYTVFYNNYTHLLDVKKAFDAMNKMVVEQLGGRSPFWIISADQQFETVFNPKPGQPALNSLVREYRLAYLQKGLQMTDQELETRVRDILKEKYIKHRSHFNFLDLVGE